MHICRPGGIYMHISVSRAKRSSAVGLILSVLAVLGMACSSSTSKSAANVPVAANTAAATSAATVPASPTPEHASLKVQLNWIPNIQHYGIEYAIKQGLYKAKNLDVSMLPGGNGVD